MTFAELTELKDKLFPSRWTYYKGGYRANSAAPEVTALPEPDVADDECVYQINAYVAEIQSCAAKFRRNRNTERLEDLISATDSLSAFLMDFTHDGPTVVPDGEGDSLVSVSAAPAGHVSTGAESQRADSTVESH